VFEEKAIVVKEAKNLDEAYQEVNEYLIKHIKDGSMILFRECTVTVGHKQYFEAFILFDESMIKLGSNYLIYSKR